MQTTVELRLEPAGPPFGRPAADAERWPPGDPPVRDAGIEAELTQTIVVAKAWDDAVRECKTLAKEDGNS